MPFVRIDLREGKSAAYRQAVGEAVHRALVGVGVPPDDRFQVIQQHGADGLLFDPHYLGIERSADFIAIQITWNEGRTLAQKQALYQAIVEGLAQSPGLRREDVLINLVEVKKENWSFGLGVAQYAT